MKRSRLVMLSALIIILVLSSAMMLFACDKDGNIIMGNTIKVEFYNGDELHASVDYKVGEEFKMPETPTKDGYTFVGWFLKDGSKFDILKVKANVKVYAKFEKNDEAVDPSDKVEVVSFYVSNRLYKNAEIIDGKVELPTDPAMDKKAFAGWYDVDNNKFDESNVKGSTNVYAKFVDIMIFVVDKDIYTKVEIIDGKVVLPTPPTKKGKDFDGWYYTYGEKLDENNVIETATVLAKFKDAVVVPPTPVVEFFDGDIPYTNINVENGKVMPPRDPIPTNENMVFAGWYLEDGVTLFDENNVTESVKVYAKYVDAIPAKLVEFYVDGELYAKSEIINGKVILPTTPEKTDMIFVGWFDKNDIKFVGNTLDAIKVNAKFEKSKAAIQKEYKAEMKNAVNKSMYEDIRYGHCGFDYVFELPTSDGTYQLIVKGIINNRTINDNAVYAKLYNKDIQTELFTILIDDKDMYFDYDGRKLMFPAFNLGEMVNATNFEKNDFINSIVCMFFDVFAKNVTKTATDTEITYSAHVDFSFAYELIKALGDVTTENFLFVLLNTLDNANINFDMILDAQSLSIKNFSVNYTDDYNSKKTVIVNQNTSSELRPSIPTIADKSVYEEMNSFNFTLEGQIIMDKTYDYAIYADIDLFSMMKIAVEEFYRGTREATHYRGELLNMFPEKLFASYTTKLYMEVKDSLGPVATIAIDPQNFGFNDMVVAFNPSKLMPAGVADAMLGTNSPGAEQFKMDHVVAFRVNFEALVAFANIYPNYSSEQGPELNVYPDENDPTCAEVAWYPEYTAQEYEVSVNGQPVVITDENNTNELGDYCVKIKSGDSVRVSVLTKDGKNVTSHAYYNMAGTIIAFRQSDVYGEGIATWATKPGVDVEVQINNQPVTVTSNSVKVKSGDSIAIIEKYPNGAIARTTKFYEDARVHVSLISNILDVAKDVLDGLAKQDVQLDANALMNLMKTLDMVVGENISTYMEMFLNKAPSIHITKKATSKAFDKANHVANFASKFEQSTQITAQSLAPTKIVTPDIRGKFVSLGANYDASEKVVPMTREEIENMLKTETVCGLQVSKIGNVNWNNYDVQIIPIILSDVLIEPYASFHKAIAGQDRYSLIPTNVVYTEVQLKR